MNSVTSLAWNRRQATSSWGLHDASGSTGRPGWRAGATSRSAPTRRTGIGLQADDRQWGGLWRGWLGQVGAGGADVDGGCGEPADVAQEMPFGVVGEVVCLADGQRGVDGDVGLGAQGVRSSGSSGPARCGLRRRWQWRRWPGRPGAGRQRPSGGAPTWVMAERRTPRMAMVSAGRRRLMAQYRPGPGRPGTPNRHPAHRSTGRSHGSDHQHLHVPDPLFRSPASDAVKIRRPSVARRHRPGSSRAKDPVAQRHSSSPTHRT